MTGGELGDDGVISDLPWASVFDPANNMRALGEIQARGFRAATELVDRFVRMNNRDRVKPTNAATESSSCPEQDETPKPATTLDADRLLATSPASSANSPSRFEARSPQLRPESRRIRLNE